MLKDLRRNPLMLTDVYNLSHQRLKINTDWEVSHIYNRKRPMILFGFSEIVNSVLTVQITHEMINEADNLALQMGVKFPRELFERVVDEHNGYFPIHVQSLPEGTYVPQGTPFAQVRNTAEGFGELVTWLEGIFLHSYFPCTTATQAMRMRKYLEMKKKQYGYDDSFMIRLHSFGFRGHRSLEDAYFASQAWNLFLLGTDDFHSKMHQPTAQVGSISALAHKVTQQFDDEYSGYKHAVDATADAGEKIVAIVIDTYDSERFISSFLVPLANYAKSRGVHIVCRPDSGDTWAQVIDIHRVVKRHKFTNVTAIIGENMDFENIKKADSYFEMHNVPLNFVSYGVGGGFYNYVERDTLGFAMKTSFSNGKNRMKFGMTPIKKSIPGVVTLKHDPIGNIVVNLEKEYGEESLYKDVYFHNAGEAPTFEVADWNETRLRALEQSTDQHQILLASEIHDLVDELERKYR
jgi:nicotinamide phosphoribosyltransferase